jgi:hypothetical protein
MLTAARQAWDYAQNGGSVRGYQAIFVPLAAVRSPGYSPLDGQPAVYLSVAALEVIVLNCRRPGAGSAWTGPGVSAFTWREQRGVTPLRLAGCPCVTGHDDLDDASSGH